MKYFPKMYNGYCCSTREVIILTVTLSSSFFPRKVLTENLITNPTRFFLIKEIMQPNKKKTIGMNQKKITILTFLTFLNGLFFLVIKNYPKVDKTINI